MNFVEKVQTNAKKSIKIIVFPEANDPRVLKAAHHLKRHQLVEPVLLGDQSKLEKIASENETSIQGIKVINPESHADLSSFGEEYYELRKHKGMSQEQASETVLNPLFFAAFLVRRGMADGALAGSIATTGDVMRAAIQVVGLAEGIKAVSSSFIMILPDGKELAFGDCAVLPNPDVEQLASVAVSSARTFYRLVGKEPAVAMLSFSSKGSAKHEDVDKVVAATELVQSQNPNLKIDGELQFDTAYLDSVAKRKAPDSPVAGNANVYIFPDLDSANIGYKIAQRIGKAEAIGPVIQGVAKPYNDLSRGCSVDDIVNVACICSILA